MDLTKMDSVVEVHDEDFYATVEPGVTRTALNNYIRDTGLCFLIGQVLSITFVCVCVCVCVCVTTITEWRAAL